MLMLNRQTFRVFQSYQVRLLLSIFSVGFVLSGLLVANRITLTRKLLYEREIGAINTLGSYVAYEIADDLAHNDRFFIYRALSLLEQQRGVDEVSIIDIYGIVRYSTNPAIEQKRNGRTDSPANLRQARDSTFYRTFPITLHSSLRGYVQIGFSMHELQANISRTLDQDVKLALVMLLLILLISWTVSSILLRPLAEMTDISNRMANGDFSLRTHTHSHDIIGRLAYALNHMAAQLGDLTATMARRIKTATADLEQSNAALREKTAQLEDSNKKLMELDRLKSDFVSMVSHELRTPLTSIIGFSKTLQILELPREQQKNYLHIIEAEGKRLAGLVGEYLDISKIESGHFPLTLAPVDCAALIEEIQATYLVQKDVRLVSRIAPGLPLVQGERGRLKQVLLNLIDNAVRYSPPGGSVTISAEADGANITICVRDQGPGLKPGDYDKIFTKFFQGMDNAAEKSKGSGLGLAIARGIVEAHHGRIWHETGQGHGAVFCFCLPVSAPAPAVVPLL